MAGAAAAMVLVAFSIIACPGVSGHKLSLTIVPANGDIQLGESQFFLCKLGSGEATFQWIMPDGEQVQEDEEEYLLKSIDESSVGITIKASSVNQNGVFRCRAESDSGDTAEQNIYVRVIQKPTFTGNEKPYSEFDEGSNAEIRCSVSGIPQPSIAWIRNGSDITKLKDARVSVTQGKLRIARVRPSDSGMYSCRASIEARNEVEQKTFTLSVNVPAMASAKDNSTTVMGGTNSTATLICLVKGHPQPNITWSRSGKPIQAVEGKYAFNSDASELKIQHVEKADEGEYNCTASNKLAQHLTTMSLHVLVRKLKSHQGPLWSTFPVSKPDASCIDSSLVCCKFHKGRLFPEAELYHWRSGVFIAHSFYTKECNYESFQSACRLVDSSTLLYTRGLDIWVEDPT